VHRDHKGRENEKASTIKKKLCSLLLSSNEKIKGDEILDWVQGARHWRPGDKRGSNQRGGTIKSTCKHNLVGGHYFSIEETGT